MNRKLTTNSRLVNELFANYISTFAAFCELLNNSIQAKSKNIWIEIDYTLETEIHPLLIKKISVKDDGNGVHMSDIERKLLDIGTANKDGGKGIGRFASFQIGQEIEIETIGYSQEDKTFTETYIPLSFNSFGKNINVSEIELATKENPLNDRSMHYLGREYMYYKRWNDAIDTLEKHLERANMLIEHKHQEPFSHQAIAMSEDEYEMFTVTKLVIQ